MTSAIVFLMDSIKNVTVSRRGILCVEPDNVGEVRLEMRLCLRPPKSYVPLICSDAPPMACGRLDAQLRAALCFTSAVFLHSSICSYLQFNSAKIRCSLFELFTEVMVAKTTKTVRVTEIPLSVKSDEIASFAARLSTSLKKKTAYSSASCPSAKQWTPPTSLCRQSGYQVGTITLPSGKHRQNALTTSGTGWQFDDVFDEVTVVHDSPNPTVESVSQHPPR